MPHPLHRRIADEPTGRTCGAVTRICPCCMHQAVVSPDLALPLRGINVGRDVGYKWVMGILRQNLFCIDRPIPASTPVYYLARCMLNVSYHVWSASKQCIAACPREASTKLRGSFHQPLVSTTMKTGSVYTSAISQ